MLTQFLLSQENPYSIKKTANDQNCPKKNEQNYKIDLIDKPSQNVNNLAKEVQLLNYEMKVTANELYIPRFRKQNSQEASKFMNNVVANNVLSQNQIFIYTDGSLIQDKFGGWAFFVCNSNKDIIHQYCGPIVFQETINSHICEGLAILKSLRLVARRYKNITVYSDCQDLIYEFCQREHGGERSLSRRREYKEIPENAKLIRSIRSIVKKENLNVNWVWIKAHIGEPGNEVADTLAKIGAQIARTIELKNSD